MRSSPSAIWIIPFLALCAGAGWLAPRFFRGDPSPPPPELSEARPPARLSGRRVPVGEPLPVAEGELSRAEGGIARWNEINNRAIEELAAGELERAVELLESCVEGEPERDVFRLNLAEALARLARARRAEGGQPGDGIELLERAFELAPDREGLEDRLGQWRREAEVEGGFWREGSASFELSYDGERAELLHESHRVLDTLEAAYGELREAFGRDPVVEAGGRRIRVVLYRRESFDRVTGLGDWAGGAFDGTIRVPVGDLEGKEAALTRVLRHELVHAFVQAVGGSGVPGWLNEGLAQWLEAPPAGLVAVARSRLSKATLFGLEELGGNLASWKDAEAIHLAYAQSVALCDFIAYHYGERVLFRMVAGCAQDRTVQESFEASTGVPLAAVLEDLRADL